MLRLDQLLLAMLVLAGADRTADPAAAVREYAPLIDPANFQAAIDHPFFPLVPGTRFTYRETARGRSSENEVTVTRDTKVVLGVTCVVVHDVLKTRGRIVEDTFDWFAQDKQGNVWYFGEATKDLLPRGGASTEGSWEAGAGGAQPGIIMPARAAPGRPYRQEYLRGHAEDMGQIAALADSVTVPYGNFHGCLRTKEWSLLEPGSERKWYARGVGLIRSESSGGEVSELISVAR